MHAMIQRRRLRRHRAVLCHRGRDRVLLQPQKGPRPAHTRQAMYDVARCASSFKHRRADRQMGALRPRVLALIFLKRANKQRPT